MDKPALNTTRQSIDQAIAEALSVSLPELIGIDYDASLTGDIGLDSVQVMDLMMEIEDRLDVSIPIELLAETHTLNELAARLVPLVDTSEL
ncbi:MAG: acyl carrier protein [Pseudomonadota bacterium]